MKLKELLKVINDPFELVDAKTHKWLQGIIYEKDFSQHSYKKEYLDWEVSKIISMPRTLSPMVVFYPHIHIRKM